MSVLTSKQKARLESEPVLLKDIEKDERTSMAEIVLTSDQKAALEDLRLEQEQMAEFQNTLALAKTVFIEEVEKKPLPKKAVVRKSKKPAK